MHKKVERAVDLGIDIVVARENKMLETGRVHVQLIIICSGIDDRDMLEEHSAHTGHGEHHERGWGCDSP